MAITESHINDVDTDTVPKYEPSRPYTVLEPSWDQYIIDLDESDPISPFTIYDSPTFSSASGGHPSPPPQEDDLFRITVAGDFRVTDDNSRRVYIPEGVRVTTVGDIRVTDIGDTRIVI